MQYLKFFLKVHLTWMFTTDALWKFFSPKKITTIVVPKILVEFVEHCHRHRSQKGRFRCTWGGSLKSKVTIPWFFQGARGKNLLSEILNWNYCLCEILTIYFFSSVSHKLMPFTYSHSTKVMQPFKLFAAFLGYFSCWDSCHHNGSLRKIVCECSVAKSNP